MHAPFAPVAHQPSRELRRSGRRRVLKICGLCEGPLAEQADTLLLCLAKFGNDDPAGGALRAYAAATVAAVVLSRHIGVCAVKGQLALLARCDDAVGRPAGGL
eukprot:CAMPEP_0181211960 /NCGR_PEP_ID=MMETSP1096-20121128/24080_1 /TAXON_ID=156174 ORGANISM="Chrysochromulina ericina, Strain CCMP281" /NCGR_SAMPLE_ID=MMETSP1096 /ASSEMBLY_ACC=CAM_ASM_000453 /LENGTH=102 /DNA_ID=CAMNT_0023303427 /DNA_START=307 /DNA_END=615 /DNA_ORIENTATION=+